MSKAKAMGTAVETAAVRWFEQNGFPEAERIALRGNADRGDIRLQKLPTVIVECKRAQLGVQLTPWMRELAVEMANAGAETGMLVAKQRGAGDKTVCRWVAAMWFNNFMPLYERHMGSASKRETKEIPEDWFILEQVSPTKINSTYIPTFISNDNRTRSRPSGWSRIPFAITYTPGHPDQQMVVGPLEQFVALLLGAGYGD